MRDRVLLYAIGISFVAHLGAVCVIGRASGSRLGVRDVSKPNRYVAVEFARENTPEKPAVANRPTPPPEPPKHVVPPHNLATNPPDPPSPGHAAARPGNRPTTGTRPAGNPGSALNTGSTSTNGDLPGVQGGNTPMAWVPGTGTGTGKGSGSGQGTGNPDPPKHVDDGPGKTPAPNPVTPPPPKMVRVRICEASGLLPGEHCKNTRTKSFVDGDEPRRTCNQCKAPEPPHYRVADSAVPVFISGPKPRIPDSVDEGVSLSARVDCMVNADGNVSGARISKSSGNSELDRNILSAVSRWKYKPAVQDGVPQSVKYVIPFSFRT